MSTPFDHFLEKKGAIARVFSSDAIPQEVYHAEKRFVSKHMLDTFSDSPEKYRYALEHSDDEQKETDNAALRFGAAFHCLVLEPEKFDERYATLPAEVKVRRGEKWETFRDANAGKEILTQEETTKLREMKDAIMAHQKARVLLAKAPGEVEQTILFRDVSHDGRPCKARLDRVIPSERIVVDLKTCTSAAPKAFASAVERYRYDVQAAFYLNALTHVDFTRDEDDGKSWKDWSFAIVAIEKEPPYAVAVYFLSEWIALGTATMNLDLDALCRAEHSGIWQGYEVPGDELPISPFADRNRRS